MRILRSHVQWRIPGSRGNNRRSRSVACFIADRQDDSDEELDMLSDSDVEEEAEELYDTPAHQGPQLTTTVSRASTVPPRRSSTSADVPPAVPEDQHRDTGGEPASEEVIPPGEGHASQVVEEEDATEEMPHKREITPSVGRTLSDTVMGPKKTRVMVRDAAWSTWWAVLYWVRFLFVPSHTEV